MKKPSYNEIDLCHAAALVYAARFRAYAAYFLALDACPDRPRAQGGTMSKPNKNHDYHRLTDDENIVRRAVCGHSENKGCQRFQFCEDRPFACDEFRAGMRVLRAIKKPALTERVSDIQARSRGGTMMKRRGRGREALEYTKEK